MCLLRAFHCAHDLILENKGMLTTLTVAVVLPLSQTKGNRSNISNYASKSGDPFESDRSKTCDSEHYDYVCCVCNVGDTLAYVYSQKYGVRELTKGNVVFCLVFFFLFCA